MTEPLPDLPDFLDRRNQQPNEQDDMAKVVSFRDARAKRINDRLRKWGEDALAIGKDLLEVRDTFPVTNPNNAKSARPGWHDWVEQNLDVKPGHVGRLILTYERAISAGAPITGSAKLIGFLLQDNVPEAGRKEVIRRLNKGEPIGIGRAKEIIQPHLPTRSQAIKQAQETGKLVAARDGNLYSGASEDEIAAYSVRREAVYSLRRAVKAVADCEFTPTEWIKAAEDHWLTEFRLAEIDAAIKWLSRVRPLLEKRQGVIDGHA